MEMLFMRRFFGVRRRSDLNFSLDRKKGLRIFMLQNIKYSKTTFMYKVLDKDMIEKETVAFYPITTRGFPSTVALHVIMYAIPYRVNSGVEWEQLPVSSLFEKVALSRQSVHHH